MGVFLKILRVGEGKKLKGLQSLVPDINAFAGEYKKARLPVTLRTEPDPKEVHLGC